MRLPTKSYASFVINIHMTTVLFWIKQIHKDETLSKYTSRYEFCDMLCCPSRMRFMKIYCTIHCTKLLSDRKLKTNHILFLIFLSAESTNDHFLNALPKFSITLWRFRSVSEIIGKLAWTGSNYKRWVYLKRSKRDCSLSILILGF